MPDLEFERITLNAIPTGELPVFHASQFETARPFIADLFWGEVEFAPGEGCWCTLSIRKVDDTLVIIDELDIVNNEVSCLLSQQAVACSGENICQLKVWNNDGESDKCIACLNFVLNVQRDPEAGGITSESEIQNLTEQIEEITQQVIGDDYYDKDEVDALLADKADKSDTYTKTQTDNLLNDKADKSTTYTKTQVDSALALKADKSTTYTKSETNTLLSAKANSADLATVATTGDYDDLINKPTIPAAQVQSDYAQADNTQVDYIKNKPDINGMIAAALLDIMPVGEVASAAVANFNTTLSIDLVDCKCTITATGGYDADTQTPHTINGYTGLTLTVADGSMVTQETYPVSWQDEAGTVYGGNLDLTTGVLTVTHSQIANLADYNWTLISNERWATNALISLAKLPPDNNTKANLVCSTFEVRTISSFVSTGNGIGLSFDGALRVRNGSTVDKPVGDLVYELATPITYQLDPVTVRALVGDNNVFSDVGDTSVKYKDSIQHYIDERI